MHAKKFQNSATELRVCILEAVQIKIPLESEMLHRAISAHQLAGLCHHSTGSHFKQLLISDFSSLRCCLVSLVHMCLIVITEL